MNASSSSSLSVEKKLSATALSQHCRGRESDWSMRCSLMRRPADVKRDSEVSPSSSPRLPFLRRTRPQPRFHSHSLWTPLGVRCTLGSDREETLPSVKRSCVDARWRRLGRDTLRSRRYLGGWSFGSSLWGSTSVSTLCSSSSPSFRDRGVAAGFVALQVCAAKSSPRRRALRRGS